MAQVTDRTVGANPTGFDMRTELNNIISALESDNSGASEPLNTVAGMKWLDTSNATYYYYKERNHDNTAWVTLFRYTVATKVMEAVSNGVVLQDSELVHKTGNETIAGVKTFSSSPIVPNATTATQSIAYGQAVKLTGNETIAGVKTFSSSPIVPNATTATQSIAYGQAVKLTGNETIAGVKTFTSFPITPSSAPTTDYQSANKKYVDDKPLSGTIQGIKVGNTAIADATTLDWYEEGTFTPYVAGSSTPGIGTYTAQIGKYTRVGNKVTIEINLSITNHTGTGGIFVYGLPFANNNVFVPCQLNVSNLTFTGIPGCRIGTNDSNIQFITQTTNASIAAIFIDTAFSCEISATYLV